MCNPPQCATATQRNAVTVHYSKRPALQRPAREHLWVEHDLTCAGGVALSRHAVQQRQRQVLRGIRGQRGPVRVQTRLGALLVAGQRRTPDVRSGGGPARRFFGLRAEHLPRRAALGRRLPEERHHTGQAGPPPGCPGAGGLLPKTTRPRERIGLFLQEFFKRLHSSRHFDDRTRKKALGWS